jgi:hypothetical protein
VSIGIRIGDIPQAVLDEVILSLKNYLVALYVLLPEKPQPRLRLIGSGTLVEIEGTHYILTAAHVWHETRGAEKIGLVLTENQSSFMIPRDSICAEELWNGQISEWGPDIALLRLATAFVPTITAHKSFLNLARQKESLASCPPVTENGLWAVTGMVGEFSEFQAHPQAKIIEGHVHGSAFITSVQQAHQRGEYDYFDLGANLQLPGAPSSFGGVSGGGLWEVKLSMTKSKEISWNEKRYFRGVAFWQSEVSDDHRMIRCHGPKSIFEKAWESWALPRGRG